MVEPRRSLSERLPATGGQPAEIARVVNGLLDGQSENSGRVTLVQSTTSTVIRSPIFRGSTVLILVPRSQTAAGIAWWISSVDRGAITVGHDAPGSDVEFSWLAAG